MNQKEGHLLDLEVLSNHLEDHSPFSLDQYPPLLDDDQQRIKFLQGTFKGIKKLILFDAKKAKELELSLAELEDSKKVKLAQLNQTMEANWRNFSDATTLYRTLYMNNK